MRTHSLYAFLIAGAYAADARAVDYFVSPAGDDKAAGSAAAPWKTLQHAAETVTAGDTVTVADGTYAGFACDGKSGTAASRIVFKSQTQGGAKINAAGQGADAQDFVQLASCSFVTIDGSRSPARRDRGSPFWETRTMAPMRAMSSFRTTTAITTAARPSPEGTTASSAGLP